MGSEEYGKSFLVADAVWGLSLRKYLEAFLLRLDFSYDDCVIYESIQLDGIRHLRSKPCFGRVSTAYQSAKTC